MTHKYSVTPEAANDLAHDILDSTTKRFHHATVENFDIQGAPKQTLRLHYELIGFEFGKDYTHYSIIEMPIDNVLEFLKFGFATVTAANELSHEERLPAWFVEPLQG